MAVRLVGILFIAALAAGGRAGAQVASPEHRSPPPSVRHDQHVIAGGAVPPAGTWINPYKGDKQAALEGAKMFGAMNCDGCHGCGGVGWVGPSLADGRWRFGGADGEIFQSIFYGRPHGMPAYGGLLLSPDAIWKLVTYIQSLEPPADVPTESWR